ncbi:COR domain-containing protein [Rheinheimera gaetbuli]
MELNKNDAEVLDRLSKSLGVEIPIVNKTNSLPDNGSDSSSKSGRQFSNFTSKSNFGCFADDKGNVVGLALCEMKLTSVPKEIFELEHLSKLNLGDNLIARIPAKISTIKKLQHLQLYGNKIKQIPDSVSELKSLTMLNVGQNRINKFPVCIAELRKLKTCYLFNNDIKVIPEAFFGYDFNIRVVRRGSAGREMYKEFRNLYIEDNPIEFPPIEIISHGKVAVLSYLSSLSEEKTPLSEAKMIVIGDGGAGKTSLVKRLTSDDYDPNEPQTHGINIESFQVQKERDVFLNIWDFGGQDIMHATHQFFLSKRSLYVLVLDGRKEEDPEYWLKHIQTFGGKSPVVIVLNKIDQHPSFDVNRKFLQQKYPAIKGFHKVSCDTGLGLEQLKNSIIDCLDYIDIISTEWPISWFNIKRKLQKIDDHFLSYDEFSTICESEGVSEMENQHALVDFLHDLGAVVHFSDFRLKDTHVLDPRWLTGAVYKIINSNILAENHGILSVDEVSTILHCSDDGYCYPLNTHHYIVNMMKKFELCYSVSDESILVPDLLDIQEPDFDFDVDGCVQLDIQYDFMPKSIMPRLIVRMNHYIKNGLRWRTGAVLHDVEIGATAVIRSDSAAKLISILVSGKNRRDFLTIIRACFFEINNSFENMLFSEKVPMPDNKSVSVSYRHLINLEEQGHEDYFPDGGDHNYNIQALLGNIRASKKFDEAEIERILNKIVKENDTKEDALEKANSILMMQPNFFGFGINLNAIVEKFWKGRKN